MPKQTIVLAVLDGWGIGKADASNPIHVAHPLNINRIKHNYPAGSLQASGIAVGLPWNEEGNSEVGHLTLGAGKVIYQHFPRVSSTIKDGSFFKNRLLLDAFAHAKENNSRVHLVGLLTDSGVHAHLDHLQALLKLADKETFPNVYLHLFTDGKDSAPKGALKFIKQIPQEKIASISGRFFAMDRDLHWDRTAQAYGAIVKGESPSLDSPSDSRRGGQAEGRKIDELLKDSYERGLTDEFIEPTVLKPEGGVKDGDSLIFFNFREDSIRQLTEMFINPRTGSDPERGVDETHQIPKNLYLVTFTEYRSKFNLPVAFPPEAIVNPLGKVLADNGKVQLRIAETEKYAHVTYFFNGFEEQPFKNEYRVLIPSRNVARLDEFPEMMAESVTTRVASALGEGVYDFILVNYANPDMIAHTGNFSAGVKAVSAIDKAIGVLTKAALTHNHVLIVTADHGNIERMIDPRTGLVETKHDPSQVPFYLVRAGGERPKSDALIKRIESENIGVLSDVAPTILHLMGLPVPKEMTGINLLDLLQ